ncbi:MAG: SDR family oxidoreductase [Gemmatimonadaceae bacterium]
MILVAGATGVLGSEIVRRLRERGESVRALVRESSAPEKIAALQKAGAEIVRGDLKDAGTLRDACNGARAVISTVTSITTARDGDSFAATDANGTRNLVDAVSACGGEQFVFVSFDTTKSPEGPLTAAKREVEEHLKRSGLTYTILQPSLFMESWLGPMLFADPAAGTAKVYGEGTHKLRYVAVADVAELAVQCIGNPAARNAVIAFGGPDEISQREAVRIFEEEFGKPFEVIEIPAHALEAQWKSAENPTEKAFASLLLGLARGFDSGVGPPPKDFPMQLTSPHDFVRRMARGG